jgi:hypothetical protein
MRQDLSTILESETSAISRPRTDYDDSQDDAQLQLPLVSRSQPTSGRQSPESATSSQLDLSTSKLGEEVRDAMTSKTVGWSSDVLDGLGRETRAMTIEPLNPDIANLLGSNHGSLGSPSYSLSRPKSSSPIRESPFDDFNAGAQSSPTRPQAHRRIPTLSSLPKGPQPSSGTSTQNNSPTSRTSFDQLRDKDRFTPRRNLQIGPSPNLSSSQAQAAARDRLYSPASRFATPMTTRLPNHRHYPFSDSESTTPSMGRPATRFSSDTPASRPGSAMRDRDREHNRSRSMSVSETPSNSQQQQQAPLRQYSGTTRSALRNTVNRSASASHSQHHPLVGQIGPSSSRAFAAAGLLSDGSVNGGAGGGQDSRARSRLSDDVRSSSGGIPSRLSDYRPGSEHTRGSSIDRPSSGMRSTISTSTNAYSSYVTPSRSSVSGETEASSAYGGGGGGTGSRPVRPGRNRSMSHTFTMSELGVLSSSSRHGSGSTTSRTGSSLSVAIPSKHNSRNNSSNNNNNGSDSVNGSSRGSPSYPSPPQYHPYPRAASSRSSPTFTGSTSTATTSTSAASSAILAMREKHELEMEALLSALSDSQRTSKMLREENNGLRDKVIVLEEEVDEIRTVNEDFRAALVDVEAVKDENEELRERIAQLEAKLEEAMEYARGLQEEAESTRAMSRKYMRLMAVSPLARNMVVAVNDDDDEEEEKLTGFEPLPSASTIHFQTPKAHEYSELVSDDYYNDNGNGPSIRRPRKSPSLSSAEFPNMPSNMSMLLHDPGETQLERDSFMYRDDDDDGMDAYHENHWDDHGSLHDARSPSPTLMLGATTFPGYHHHPHLYARRTSSGNLSQSTENLSMLTENLPDSPHSLELRPEHEMHLEEMPSQLDLRLQPEHELFPQLLIGADHR